MAKHLLALWPMTNKYANPMDDISHHQNHGSTSFLSFGQHIGSSNGGSVKTLYFHGRATSYAAVC